MAGQLQNSCPGSRLKCGRTPELNVKKQTGFESGMPLQMILEMNVGLTSGGAKAVLHRPRDRCDGDIARWRCLT